MPNGQNTIALSDIASINLSKKNIEKILCYLIFGGIIFIVTFPLIGDYGKLLFPLGRDIFFRIAVEIIFFLYLILIALDRNYLPKFSLISLFLLLYLLASGFAALFSVQPQFSFWGNIFRGHGFFSQIHYFLFFTIIAGTLKTWRHWKTIILAAIFVSFPVTLIGLAEIISGAPRIQSTLNNPTFYGAYLLLMPFITFARLGELRAAPWRIILFVLLFLQILNIYFTRSIGNYLGFMTGLIALLMFFAALKFRGTGTKKIFISAILCLILIGIAGSVILLPRMFSKERLQTAIAGRYEPWQAAWQGIKEKPFWGFGPENFIVVSDKYFSGKTDEDGYAWWDKAHNFILEIGATTGFIGLAAYLGIWINAFWYLLSKNITRISSKSNPNDPSKQNEGRQKKSPYALYPIPYTLLKIGLLSTFVAYLTQNLFNIDTTTSLIYIILYLGLTNFLSEKRDANMQTHTNDTTGITTRKKITFILLLVIIFPILFLSIKNYNAKVLAANLKFNQAEEYVQKGHFEKGFNGYEEALKINDPAVSPHIRYRYGEVAISLATQRKYFNLAGDQKNLKRALELQEENGKKEWPYFTRNWIFAGTIANFLYELGEFDYRNKADVYFQKALELSPKRSSIWLEWAKTDILTGYFEGAQKKVEKAISLNPNYGKSWWQYAILNIYQKKHENAQENIEKASVLGYDIYSLESLNELKDAYQRIGDQENLEKILSKLYGES